MNYFKYLFIALALCLHATQTYCSYPYEEGPSLDEMPFREAENLFDFEKGIQDYVLETKKIEIPQYPSAFNPGLIRWKGSLLLNFRIYSENGATNGVGFVYLDEKLNVVSEPMILQSDNQDAFCGDKRQDPRLIVLQDRLYIVYNNMLNITPTPEVRRMVVAEVQSDGSHFFCKKSEVFVDFDGADFSKSAKNWVPIVHEDTLYFAYSLYPHRIVRPVWGTGTCEEVATTTSHISWAYGQLRGGTPAVKDGDEYLALFHSSISMTSVHSRGIKVPHYVMGAYTFSETIPFAITRISPEPIVGKGFYSGPSHHTWKPLRVVFPMGLVIDGNTLLVSYGVQDHEIWIARFDKEKLKRSLVEVSVYEN